MKTYLFSLLLLAAILPGCTLLPDNSPLIESGVSAELAAFRHTGYEKVDYKLFFSIPEKQAEPIVGEAEISVTLREKQPVILDFRGSEHQIMYVKLNGKPVNYLFRNEHIILTGYSAGDYTIEIAFTPGDQSLNRREEYLYTLLVPDRARTVFPCFDQPDMKAGFSLTLEVPASWQAVSNGAITETDSLSEKGRKTISFARTEPLSTYLFSFVAGKLERVPFERNGREIAVYHRETDPHKAAQCPEIARQVFDALEWMEDYTGIPYPFAKYDLVILPGFQYGGMEHTGATLYNDSRMFLNEHHTLGEELGRASLIAHETAHMWFGDYVTMKWFDDVWTKEVFANYFALRITEPLFPDVNDQLNFMLDYIPGAYAEDRTAGSNPVKQPLDNLAHAGLVYGNIIYDKSPVVLDMLIRQIGEDAFRKGIRQYLQTYSYGNATWEDLIGILDQYSGEDLVEWSHIWVNEKGMPTIHTAIDRDTVRFTQSDPWGRGLVWPQQINYLRTADGLVIPNPDGLSYGYFELEKETAGRVAAYLDTCTDEITRGSLLITLYENLLNKTIAPEWYLEKMAAHLAKEQNPLLFSLTAGYIGGCLQLHPSLGREALERDLWQLVATSPVPAFRLQAFRLYGTSAQSPGALGQLFHIWETQTPPEKCVLSESDYIRLSYRLAILLPEKADGITATQQARITNPDRAREYAFIAPSVSPTKEVRDSVFQSLLKAENRRIEPWAATALANLNHSARQQEAIAYIRPALDAMQEIQQTGDIFFPRSWARALLAGHTSKEAKEEVDRFFADHPGYPEMLGNKIKQQSDFLARQ